MIPGNLGIIFTGDTQYPLSESGGVVHRARSFTDYSTKKHARTSSNAILNKKVFQESSIPFDVGVSNDKFVVYAAIFKI